MPYRLAISQYKVRVVGFEPTDRYCLQHRPYRLAILSNSHDGQMGRQEQDASGFHTRFTDSITERQCLTPGVLSQTQSVFCYPVALQAAHAFGVALRPL